MCLQLCPQGINETADAPTGDGGYPKKLFKKTIKKNLAHPTLAPTTEDDQHYTDTASRGVFAGNLFISIYIYLYLFISIYIY